MSLTALCDQVEQFATEYAAVAYLTGPDSDARVAVFWCISMLRTGASQEPARAGLRMLSLAIGRPANGSDLIAILERDLPVPYAVAGLISDAFG